MMTPEQRKQWIDGASYDELRECWQLSPFGSDWGRGEVGEYFREVMAKKCWERQTARRESRDYKRGN